MAVKRHELVTDNSNQLDLRTVVNYVQMMNDQPHYVPPPVELIKNCQDIVKCLTRVTGNEEELLEILQSMEEFLLRMVNKVHISVRHDLITAIMHKMYSIISDPEADAAPATSVLFVIFNRETTMSNARWLVEQGAEGPAGTGLKATLSCFYGWILQWHGKWGLGDWVVAYIKALEELGRFDILVDVSVDNLSQLFLSLGNPVQLRACEADVIFHVLTSLRENPDAFTVVAPHVRSVLTNLASDSKQSSRQHLQNVVDIVTAMADFSTGSQKETAVEAFKEKHSDVFSCLECHIASRSSQYMDLSAWGSQDLVIPTGPATTSYRKVGLYNLGNTCYMNSVLQALLATKPFSAHVLLRMNKSPYWSQLSTLFSRMVYTINLKVSPDEVFSLFKPPFFTLNHQHDSSEFLGYLFMLLQSYEHVPIENFEYPKVPVLTPSTFLSNVHYTAFAQSSPSPAPSSENEQTEPANRRSVSPRPSSSNAGTSSSYKRSSSERDLPNPPKKRMRLSNDSPFLRRDSVIDNMFGGVLLTRIECTECHSTSLSRDIFRDLQLAFPDKEGEKEHSVQSLLEYYCSKEMLAGDNQYYCGDCGGLRDAERSVRIEATPKFLILVLKHFKFEPKQQSQTKLLHSMYHNHTVSLPTVRTQTQHSTYRLYAVVVHSGSTLDSGHYYTLAKDSGQWHVFNDDNVALASEKDVNSHHTINTPYILFYRRTDVEDGRLPAVEQLPENLREAIAVHNKFFVDCAAQRVKHP